MAVLSVLISTASALILFIAHAKTSIVSDVSNFLVLGKPTLTTIQRELGYDQLVGYDYAEKHLKEKFGFTKITAHDTFEAPCLISKLIYAADDSIEICLQPSQTYLLIKKMETLRGDKVLVLEKSHRFSSDTFINFTLIILGMISLFSLLFIWFYREIMKVVFQPFHNVYKYLNGDGAYIDSSLLEVSKLYEAIKQRSKIELELAELEKKTAVFKAIATTTQMVAHDVRLPMDMVSKFIRRVPSLSYDSLIDYAKKSAPSLERATTDVYRMLEDLMDISAKNHQITKEPTDLANFLDSVIREFDDEHVEVTVTGIQTAPFDKAKLKRVLSNILRNSFDAAKRPARFWIEASSNEGSLVLKVGNTGSHIPAENLEDIFDTFYTSGKGNGKGLGLAITKKFVEDHDGEIWCESNGMSLNHIFLANLLENYVIFYIKIPLTHAII